MTVASAPGDGTTFELRMPIWRGKTEREEEDGRRGEAQENARKSDRARVLVVEDDEAVRSFLARVLSSRGYDYQLAGSGLEARDEFRDRGVAGSGDRPPPIAAGLSPVRPHSRFLRPVPVQQLAYLLGMFAAAGQFL